MQSKVLSTFRKIAIIEGISFLLLGVTMILKYKFDNPLPNYIVGMAHGFLFILYVILLFWLFIKEKWNLKDTLLAFVASLLPTGTFIADKYIFSKK